ncbi:serine hydrolase [Parasphingopyxis sp.]|uniref:serine hydrolase domain-containing protein n=1 Tax=Parasphingopyxis sp. TaxID=1920299 RepID=UPI002618F3E8|nr:serine hydrolase domain-containing protein [Parasphingopyxis sp.]
MRFAHGLGITLTIIVAAPVLARPAVDYGAPICSIIGDPVRPDFDQAARVELETTLRDMVDRGIAPGVVMMVEQGGETVFSFAHGAADPEQGEPMAEDTLFRLYSMTKPVTSIVALQLVAEGRLSLDDPVSDYIQEFADIRMMPEDGESEPVAPVRPVTIGDLLTHTAGLTYRTNVETVAGQAYFARGIPAGPGVDQPPIDGSDPVSSIAELVRRVAAVPLLSQPGTAFTYGNATDVLGRVIEIVSDAPLSDVFDARILTPLGMPSTSFHVAEADLPRLSSAYAAPAQFPDEGEGVATGVAIDRLGPATLTLADPAASSLFASPPAIEYGGAGLVGTAGDYLRFTTAVREMEMPDGSAMLPASLAEAMRSDQLTPEARLAADNLDGLGFGYGFAVRLNPTAEAPVFPQCGYFWGGAASTFFWIDPAGETSGVIMTQVFGGDVRSYFLEAMRILYAAE